MEPRDKNLVVALGGALGCALLTIAYLLGRISAKPSEPVRLTVAGPANPASVSAASDPTRAGGSETSREGAPYPAAGGEGRARPALEPLPPPAPSNAGLSPAPDRPQITTYFAQVDRLEDIGSGDPQAFAKSLMDSIASGDFSGFDDLLAKSRAQRDRLRAIAPPRACVEHHRIALALSGDSVAMMERLKAAFVKGDATALMSLTTEGRALEAQAIQLKAMGEAIKRQAGR